MLLRVFLSAFGSLLMLNSVVLSVVSNFNAGNILEFIGGAAIFVWGVFDDKIYASKHKVFWGFFKAAVIAGISVSVGFSAFLLSYGYSDTVNYGEDALIVLGAAVNGDTVTEPLRLRLDKAVEYLNANPSAIVVVTGGKGPQENVTEAYAMEQYLINHGIAPERVIKEEQASSTSENYKYSKEILDSKFGTYRAAVVTNRFHIYRAVKLAEIAGLDVNALHAPTSWYSVVPMYLREILAVIKLWIFKY